MESEMNKQRVLASRRNRDKCRTLAVAQQVVVDRQNSIASQLETLSHKLGLKVASRLASPLDLKSSVIGFNEVLRGKAMPAAASELVA